MSKLTRIREDLTTTTRTPTVKGMLHNVMWLLKDRTNSRIIRKPVGKVSANTKGNTLTTACKQLIHKYSKVKYENK
ncbi:hypothetical protein HMPREF1214_03350 [Bacteroides sp. HPS0048]|nr:hypothetical protein HMPREF1214_03350 [Bacteroides sp. HPS0048]